MGVKGRLAPRCNLGQRAGRPRRVTGALALIHPDPQTPSHQRDG
jgi:hypothetical protein